MEQPDLTKHFARYRQRDPEQFVKGTMRTKDVGREGHSKLIVGKLRASQKYAIQSVLIDRKDYDSGARVVLQHGQPRIVKLVEVTT